MVLKIVSFVSILSHGSSKIVSNAFSSVRYSKNLTFFLHKRKSISAVLRAPIAIPLRDDTSANGVVMIIFLSGFFLSSSIANLVHCNIPGISDS
jgi:hypothetical protein